MEPRMPRRRGSSLGRIGAEPVPGYRLLRRVGSGGSGEVWCAEGPGGLPVALKLIRLSGRLGGRERSNLRILRAVRHPNLLAYFGAWTLDDLLIIGMELADGSLWDRYKEMSDRGLSGIPASELLGALGEVARVIDFLHEPRHELDGSGGVAIFHRDIKPQNIMLLGGGVKVADFGLSSLEIRGMMAGVQEGLTYPYAAPETFRRKVVCQSDQYSLAVTYCLLRGGRLPFSGPPAIIMLGHLFHAPDVSMLPEPERPIVERALAKEPAGRWADCRTFVEALSRCRAAGSPELIHTPEGEGPGHPTDSRRPLRVSATALSDIGTGLLKDSDELDEFSSSDLGTSIMMTVPSTEDDPAPESESPAFHATPATAWSWHQLTPSLSHCVGLVALAFITAMLGLLAMGETPHLWLAGGKDGQPARPAIARRDIPPAGERGLPGQPGTMRIQAPRFADGYLLYPWINHPGHSSDRDAKTLRQARGGRAGVEEAAGTPVLEGPADLALLRPDVFAVVPACTPRRLRELRAEALTWLGSATSSIDRMRLYYAQGLRAAFTTLVAFGPGRAAPRSSPTLAVPETLELQPGRRPGAPVAVSPEPVNGIYQLPAGQPRVAPRGAAMAYSYVAYDPILFQQGGITYHSYAIYESGFTDYPGSYTYYPAPSMHRAGWGRVFGRRDLSRVH
jgi:serine/threonine protein kinase